MTNRELLMRHIIRHNANILLNTSHIIVWEYNGIITTDEFSDDGSAIGRSWTKV